MFRPTILRKMAVSGGIALALLLHSKMGALSMIGLLHAEENINRYGQRYGIVGQMAPEIRLTNWIDASGQPIESIALSSLRGKVIYLYFFQHWCPACQSHGFPTLRTIARTYKGDDGVVLLAVQTAFEGKRINTVDKLRRNQIDHKVPVPMAHDAGENTPRGLPQTMIDYRSGGTPWAVIIGPDGSVAYNNFHIAPNQAIEMIERLRREKKYQGDLKRYCRG